MIHRNFIILAAALCLPLYIRSRTVAFPNQSIIDRFAVIDYFALHRSRSLPAGPETSKDSIQITVKLIHAGFR